MIKCCANVNSDVRNAPKRLRKTVKMIVYLLILIYRTSQLTEKLRV